LQVMLSPLEDKSYFPNLAKYYSQHELEGLTHCCPTVWIKQENLNLRLYT